MTVDADTAPPIDRRIVREQTRAEIKRADADAALERDARQAELRRQQRLAAATDREREWRQRRTARAARRQTRSARIRALATRLRPAAPVLLVNAAGLYGQVGYGYSHYTPAATAAVARLTVALVVAVATEYVSVYVGWHAHVALLSGATTTASRLRRISYLIACVVAGINYAHFAHSWKDPTPAAIAFGLMSLLSPWLWGLHTRQLHHLQLLDEGAVDCPGAVFGAARVRAFPIRTWKARRWSIDHGVTDPMQAWAGYNAERNRRLVAREAGRHGTIGTGRTRRYRRGKVVPVEAAPVGEFVPWPPPVPAAQSRSVPAGPGAQSRSVPAAGRPAVPAAGPGATPGGTGPRAGDAAGRPAPRPRRARPARRTAPTGTGAGSRRASPAPPEAPVPGRGQLAEVNRARDTMVAFWNQQRAIGNTPTGAELDRAAHLDPEAGYGRRVRRELLAAESAPQAAGARRAT